MYSYCNFHNSTVILYMKHTVLVPLAVAWLTRSLHGTIVLRQAICQFLHPPRWGMETPQLRLETSRSTDIQRIYDMDTQFALPAQFSASSSKLLGRLGRMPMNRSSYHHRKTVSKNSHCSDNVELRKKGFWRLSHKLQGKNKNLTLSNRKRGSNDKSNLPRTIPSSTIPKENAKYIKRHSDTDNGRLKQIFPRKVKEPLCIRRVLW